MLVRLDACGVCHSDVHIWKGEVRASPPPEPFVLGHEGVGRVVETGPGVTGFREGERVGVPWLHDTCMHCDECLDGYESFCQHQRAHGLNVPGAFAEYVVVDARFAVKIAEHLDPVATAPIMCAGVTAYGAIRRAKVKSGETVAVFGCGGLGLYAVQIAHRLGARVIAVDRDPLKLEAARAGGAQQLEIADADLGQRLRELPDRPHVAINFAPTPSTWEPMLTAIRVRGRVIAAALVPDPVPVNQEWLTGTGVTITGTSVGTRREMEEVLGMHAAQPLAAPLVEISLDGASEALAALDEGRASGRYVIRFRNP
jgi:propanol-preferring alcohol dehydrogenase